MRNYGESNVDVNTFIPMPVPLVGAHVDGKANFMAVGFIPRINANPPYIALGIGQHHYTPKGIIENGSFSVNFPDSTMVEEADYCGIVSGKKHDKSDLFELFYGKLDTAPMIQKCPLTLECKLVDMHEMPTNYLFIGEIVGSYTEDQYLSDGKIDFIKLDPLILTMRDNNYWKPGENTGKAWSAGRGMHEKMKSNEKQR